MMTTTLSRNGAAGIGGLGLYEYQPTFMHAKLLVVDGQWTVIGSANMDVRSNELNEENVLGILDRGLAKEVERTLLADLARAEEIRLDDWRRRGVAQRVLERAAVLLAEQY
jgi:cardiolipin synthase